MVCGAWQAQDPFLLAASLFFYAWGEPVYVALMIVSCLVNYLLGLAIDRYRGTTTAKSALVVAIVANLLALGFFKYADFLIETVNKVFGSSIGLLSLPLPIGMSFYTFQALSYIVDAYRIARRCRRTLWRLPCTLRSFRSWLPGRSSDTRR